MTDARRRVEQAIRAAVRMAVNLRLHWWARVLGEAGVVRALAAWAGLLILTLAAFILGGIAVLFLVAAVLVLVAIFARAGAPSHWSHWLVVAAVVLGVSSVGFVQWAFAASVDAADSFQPKPAAAAWIGVGVLVFLASGVLLVVGALVAVRRERRIARLSR